MIPEIKEKWVRALRSGEYKQAEQSLRREITPGTMGYCCLGVLTDLYCKATKTEIPDFDRMAFLPREVVEWADLDSQDPAVSGFPL